MSQGQEGRGSARRDAVAAAILICLLMGYIEDVDAAIYTVGGSTGWSFNMASWVKGKRFRAGDTLIFNYDRRLHNVVAANRASYSSCTIPARAKVYNSGKDKIKLAKGQNFFVCSVTGHCGSGMKIAVNAM